MDDTRADRADRAAVLLDEALALAASERDTFLDTIRAEDRELAGEVESLLTAHQTAPNRLDGLAARILPGVIEEVSRALGAEAPIEEQTVGRYRILGPIGSGGMGAVYKARDLELDRLVALKFLAPFSTADVEARARLKAEARAASALDHPNIATVYEIGSMEPSADSHRADRLFIAMAYYAGETVRTKVARGPLPMAEAIDYARQAADGLTAAHEAGIVHRDVKPANLIVTERGVVKILDFGVAKQADIGVTREGAALGTIAYMSPEQTYGRPVDARSDVWSLGVVLYEMLAGVRPFGAEHDAVLLHAIRHEEPERLRQLRPEVPQALARVVERCLRQEPAERYASASALSDELGDMDAVAASPPVTRAKPIEPVRWRAARRFGDEVRRRVSIAGLLGLVGLLAAAGVIAERIVQRGGNESGAPAGDALTIAVSPFTPVTSDATLEQLGRELAVTVSVALDGIEDLRTVDPRVVQTQATAAVPGSPRDRGLRLARAVGAGWFLVGRLTRWGANVRVDATLYAATESGIVARATTTGDPGDLAVLTDSVTLALLRSLWQDRPVTSPSLGAIRTTKSVTALRAYLEGEAFMARGDMPRAVEAFDRAFAADTTFWFAYWRSLYPRGFYIGAAPDSARVGQVIEHRDEFPLPDRLLIDSWLADSMVVQLRLLRRAATGFDSYWPAWYAYGNALVHRAPYLGRTYEDARAVLERTVELNPDFSFAWKRLSSVVSGQNDTAATARALGELERTTAGVEFRSAERRMARVVFDLERFGLPPPDSLERVLDWILSEPELLISFATGVDVPSVQLALNAALLARTQRARVIAALWRGNAYAWVSRGAWDSALVAFDRAVNAWPAAEATVDAYGLAVIGAVLGVSPVDEAVRRRPTLVTQRRELHAAQLAWFDGLLAYVRRDHDGLARARNTLKESSAIFVDALQQSLAAFAMDAAGDRAAAARELARLEFDNANLGRPPPLDARHPFLVSVNRLVAARWLRETGGDSEAARLLTWSDATPAAWPGPLNRTFGSIGLVDRAEIAESQDQTDRALSYYRRFLESHDMPVPGLMPLVERARDGVQRLQSLP